MLPPKSFSKQNNNNMIVEHYRDRHLHLTIRQHIFLSSFSTVSGNWATVENKATGEGVQVLTPGQHLSHGGHDDFESPGSASESRSLNLQHVAKLHQGKYLCQANNQVGVGLSKIITVTVNGKSFVENKHIAVLV